MNFRKITTLFVLIILSTNIFAQKEITLEDIWKKPTFRSNFVSGFNGLNDGETFCRLDYDVAGHFKLNRYSYKTGDSIGAILIWNQLVTPSGDLFGFEDYAFSSDETKLLISYETESIYRHSSKAHYYIFNLMTREVTPITEKGQKVMYATLSPDGKNVAYVFENNMFVKEISTGVVTQITTDGLKNSIINGGVDWVYEEEFSMSVGFEWSPDSKRIAYFKFDETKVPEFSMPMYGNLYPTNETWKYPKAGEPNSKVDVFIYTLADAKSVQCATGSERDQYLPRIKWSNDPSKLSIQRLNRHQNEWELLLADANSGSTWPIYSEVNKYYVEITDNLYFLKNGNQFIFTSEQNGFNHLWCYDFSKKKGKQLTDGKFDVVDIIAFNESSSTIYFTSSQESELENHFYSVNVEGKNLKKLSKESGNHNITATAGNNYFLDNHSTINSPNTFTLLNANGELVRVIENNKDASETLASFKMSNAEFGKFKNSEGIDLNYWMIKPPNFDQTKKYPVLFHVYGGPGINTVRNQWQGANFLWHQMLAQKGYIIISVDNRGTGYRGEAFKKSTYLQLGKLESEDQISAAKYFGSLSYVDASRIGIWGWSFGGYMSSLCISKGANVFKSAIAVAPVTNWKYYDNIYTERFLRTPEENVVGYDSNSPIHHVKLIKGNYLLIHGTADDNVHFQNTVEMVNAMIKGNVSYDCEFYPNKNHSIYGGNTRYHLYNRMTKFILEKL